MWALIRITILEWIYKCCCCKLMTCFWKQYFLFVCVWKLLGDDCFSFSLWYTSCLLQKTSSIPSLLWNLDYHVLLSMLRPSQSLSSVSGYIAFWTRKAFWLPQLCGINSVLSPVSYIAFTMLYFLPAVWFLISCASWIIFTFSVTMYIISACL